MKQKLHIFQAFLFDMRLFRRYLNHVLHQFLCISRGSATGKSITRPRISPGLIRTLADSSSSYPHTRAANPNPASLYSPIRSFLPPYLLACRIVEAWIYFSRVPIRPPAPPPPPWCCFPCCPWDETGSGFQQSRFKLLIQASAYMEANKAKL